MDKLNYKFQTAGDHALTSLTFEITIFCLLGEDLGSKNWTEVGKAGFLALSAQPYTI